MTNIEFLEIPYRVNEYPLALVKIEDNIFAMCYEKWKIDVLTLYRFHNLEASYRKLIQPRTPEYDHLYNYVWQHNGSALKYASLHHLALRKFFKEHINYLKCPDDPFIWRPVKFLVNRFSHLEMPELDNIEKFMFFLNSEPFVWTGNDPDIKVLDIISRILFIRRYIWQTLNC
jgi:hypothetical protein